VILPAFATITNAGNLPVNYKTVARKASASQPTGRTAVDTTPPAGRGRITFYRPGGIFGYAQRAQILLDGKKVGRSAPGTKFYVDTAPGTHHIVVPNIMYPGEHTLDIIIHNKAVVYVKTSLGGTAFGGRTEIEQVSASQGAQDTVNLKLVND